MKGFTMNYDKRLFWDDGKIKYDSFIMIFTTLNFDSEYESYIRSGENFFRKVGSILQSRYDQGKIFRGQCYIKPAFENSVNFACYDVICAPKAVFIMEEDSDVRKSRYTKENFK